MDIAREYYCSPCEKKYKSRQSLYNHNKRFHHDTPPHFLGVVAKNHQCKYCGKHYSRIDIVTRHQKKCKEKQDLILLKEENKTMKNEITKIKKEMMQIMNKQCKMHPKTFQKIKKQINNNNNTNNGIIINNIIQLGEENIIDLMSKAQQQQILNYKLQSVFQLIKLMHCGDIYPQFHNCVITCLKSPVAYRFDGNKKEFIAVDKNELLDDMLEYRKNDIEEMLIINQNELDTRTNEILQKLFDVLDDKGTYENNYKKKIKIMLYNEKYSMKTIKD